MYFLYTAKNSLLIVQKRISSTFSQDDENYYRRKKKNKPRRLVSFSHTQLESEIYFTFGFCFKSVVFQIFSFRKHAFLNFETKSEIKKNFQFGVLLLPLKPSINCCSSLCVTYLISSFILTIFFSYTNYTG